jgi:hypothetical protein
LLEADFEKLRIWRPIEVLSRYAADSASNSSPNASEVISEVSES